MPACPVCGEDNPPRAKFCSECGAALSTPTGGQAEVRKTVTVLFSDVTGSTSLGERLDAESLRHVLDRYFEAMRAVVERHGGTVEKFIGDAVMAVFGVPIVREDDALRAVRAAAQMREALQELNHELQLEWGVALGMRIGVNTGEVVTGQGPGGQRLVTGDAVNVAARLEQAAEPGEVFIGEGTFHLVRDAVTAEPVSLLSLKGKADPVPAHRLIAVDREAAGHERRLDSPMVGRDRQLAMLRQAFDAARADRVCHLFTVLGAAGVGKSRLVLEFLQQAPAETLVLRGRCLSYGEGITFWPVVEVIRQAAGVEGSDAPDDVRSKLLAVIGQADGHEAIGARAAELLGLDEPSGSPEEVFWAVRRLFETLARERPLILVFDDIHWAEPTLLDLIEYVGDWTKDAPILLLCPARPELLDVRPAWGGGKFNATSILLEPLPEQDCEALIDNLVGSADLPPDVRRRIAEAAEGTPLFVEEMLSMLIDEGLLQREGDRWVAAGDMEKVRVPPTIQALLAARLDMLGPDERTVLECGSVEGKVFHRGSLAAIVPEAIRPRVGQLLLTLQRRELLRPERAEFAGQDAYRFRHQLIRDAAYNGMSKERRASKHEAFAAWLDEQAPGTHEYDEILGYHLEQAARFRAELGPVDEAGRGLAARAATALAAAGHRAIARGDAPAAANLLERAMNLLPPGDRDRLELVPETADALIEMGELALARALCDQALEEATSVADPVLEMRIRVERMFVVGATEPDRYWTDVPTLIAEARPLFERAEDHRSLARVWSLEGLRLNMVGHPPEMLEANERALEHARLAQDLRTELVCQRELANTTYWGPTPAEAGLRRLDTVLEEVRGHRLVEASVERNRAGFLAMQGRFDEARGILRAARVTFEEHGAVLMVFTNSFMSGPLELWAGDPAAAERELRESCESLEAMGERAWLCSLAAFLAEALYAQGRFDEAEDWSRRAEETAGRYDLSAHADIRAVQAKVLARRGDFEAAERMAREAVDIAARTSEPDHEGDNYFDLAEVLRLAGKPKEAVDALQEALRLWEAKGNLVSAAKARSSIQELGP